MDSFREDRSLGRSSLFPYNLIMYENRRGSLPSDLIGPFDPRSYTSDVPLGNTNPTDVRAMIYNTPGNTWLNKAKGGLSELAGKYNQNTNLFLDTYRGRY